MSEGIGVGMSTAPSWSDLRVTQSLPVGVKLLATQVITPLDSLRRSETARLWHFHFDSASIVAAPCSLKRFSTSSRTPLSSPQAQSEPITLL